MTQILLILFLLFTPFTGKTEEVNTEINIKAPTEVVSNSFWVNIQSKIENAFVQSTISKNDKPLLALKRKLEKLQTNGNQKSVLYWRAYLQFQSAIYYLNRGNENKAEKETDKGVDLLEKIKKKSSEDYALLALLQGFGMQFKGIKAMFIVGDMKKNMNKAIELNPKNPRAYYAVGSNDFYRPKKYGGGKKVEKYLLKTIFLSSQKSKKNDSPSWGKEQAYTMLIQFYIREKRWSLAKKYYQAGLKEFPKSYTIKQLNKFK